MISDELGMVIEAFERHAPMVGATAVELRASMAVMEGATPLPAGTEVVPIRAATCRRSG